MASILALVCGLGACIGLQAVPVDLSGYVKGGTVKVEAKGENLQVVWPLGGGGWGQVEFNLDPGKKLFKAFSTAAAKDGPWTPLLQEAEPDLLLTIGSREAPSGRPPSMSIWNTFFDNPEKRPHQIHGESFRLERAAVRGHQEVFPPGVNVTRIGLGESNRVTVSLGNLSIGPLKGEFQVHFYAGSPLVHLEAVLSTDEDKRAFTYEIGLTSTPGTVDRFVWMGSDGRLQTAPIEFEGPPEKEVAQAARHRMVIAAAKKGSVACFPPPHRFFFPRDWSDNLKTIWFSRSPPRFGVRQPATGGGPFVPWFNAPPGTKQQLGVFFLLSRGDAEEALRETLRYTRGDRFEPLPGHITFTSHYHMAVAVQAMEKKKEGVDPLSVPEFVKVFRDMGVNAVHLGEFHGDGHQKDPGPLRLPELEMMFSECKRLSAPDLLFIPGEEVNDFLGIKEPGKHPGHWMSLFPKPVRWVMQRKETEPFAEPLPDGGTLYRVGSRADMFELLKREGGLAWAAHPRIKASSWTPDIFKNEDFYLADLYVGGAWKAMPADLSREKLGERVLDLLDDMANWGQRKYVLGEVDVFKIDHTHELYGHMNVNYLRLDRVPRYEEGWQPILDAVRHGRFFVTTGEILIRSFTVGGKQGGETLELSGRTAPLTVELDYTFPLRFLEVISGDGQNVDRQRFDQSYVDGSPGNMSTKTDLKLAGRRWVRFEAWDVAGNGAFTQPVWIEQGAR